jgi:alpha-methylacyl-CoA racemase
MTGWGQAGPLAPTAGHDINYIALAGALHPMGRADHEPPPPLNLVGDYGGGSLYLALGVLAAYIEALKSGQGQVVDAAVVDGTASLMASLFAMMASDRWTADRHANMIDGAAPFYRAYRTRDGKFISIGAIETKFYDALIEAMGLDRRKLPDQFDQSRWGELEKVFVDAFAERTRDEWCILLEPIDACFAPALTIEEMGKHPHVLSREMIVESDGVLQPAPAPRFERTPSELPGFPLSASRACADLLARWGMSERQA